jgi:heme/copper-type cytochrome/quinol oxidase subunit 2
MRKFVGSFACLMLVISSVALLFGSQDSATPASPHQIEVIAKKFEFTPNEIHVKAGERVRIKLRTADRAHGLKLNIYPERASEDGSPGLVFEHPQDEAKVDKHHDRVIEFLAVRPGT